jgi:hypothetical protein
MMGMPAHRSPHLRAMPYILCVLLSCVCFTRSARSALELNALPPAERSCASPEALGLAAGSVSAAYHDSRASVPSRIAGAYGYRPFGLAAVEVFAFCGKMTLLHPGAGIAFSYNSLTGPGYAEHVVSLSLGVSRDHLWLQPGVRLGQVTAPGPYGGRCIVFDLLTYAYVTPGLRVSFSAANAFGSGLNGTGGEVPRRVGAGLGYAVSDRVACGIRVEKENGMRTALSTGMEWQPMRGFFVRLGSCTFPREFSLGLGLRVGGLGLDVASTVNFDLGMTHEAGIRYLWK